MAKKKLDETVTAEMYLSDPLVARRYKTLGVHKVKLEAGPVVLDGPVSARIAVVDYDVNQDTLYPPAQFDADKRRFAAPEDSHQFRQINAWATVQQTLELYEGAQALGRKIPWGFESNRLLVLPHAGYWENAFYDRKTKTLQFFYFQSGDEMIYTCLAHDIVSHETGHAVLDGVRPLYNFPSSPDTAGFHEYLGDATAILSAFDHTTYLREVIREAKGDLRNPNVAARLGEQFGTALYGAAQRDFLRNAINDRTMKDVAGSWEEHAYSEVLTGAFYEILIGMYDAQWAREKEEARKRDSKASPVRALWIAVRHLRRMMLRALDYCPPADVTYLDYGRAILRADQLAYADDSRFRYRDIVRKVFLRRGIAANKAELEPYPTPARSEFTAYSFADVDDSGVAAYHFLNRNRSLLEIPANQDVQVTGLYGNAKEGDRSYQMPRELILEYVWEQDVPVKGKKYGPLDGVTHPLLCGGTLVFDERANVLYWSPKLPSEERVQRLLDYLAFLVKDRAIGTEDDPTAGARPFSAVLRRGRLELTRNPLAMHRRRS